MSNNPYSPPRAESSASLLPGAIDPTLADELRSIASYQRAIQFSILVQFGCYLAAVAISVGGGRGAAPPSLTMSILLAIFGVAIVVGAVVGAVFAVLLALRVYNIFMAVLFGFAAFVPCANLLALYMINQRATARLQEFQIPVGLLGADMQAVEERLQQMPPWGGHPPFAGQPPGAGPMGTSVPPPTGPSP